MKKKTLMFIAVVAIAKITGFLRDIFFSYYYGATSVTDAYNISQTIPLFIFGFIVVSINTAFVPLYQELKTREEKDNFINWILNDLLLFSTVFTILCYLFTPQIIKIFAKGFTGETLELAIYMTRISVLSIYFYTTSSLFSSLLQIYGKLSITGAIAIPNNIITIVGIILSYYQKSIFLLVFIGLVGTAFQLIILIPELIRIHYHYRPTINWKDPFVRRFMILAGPSVIGISINQINVLVGRTIASTIRVGGITALDYANRLDQLVIGIIAIPIVTAIYPTISKLVIESDSKLLSKIVHSSMTQMILIIIPLSMALIFFAEEVVRFLFGRGAFDATAVRNTGSALLFYSISLFALSIREITSRVFYAFKDSRTVMINSGISLGMNIVLSLVLSRFIGLNGLTIATTIATIFSSVRLLQLVNGRLFDIDYRLLGKQLGLATIISAGVFGIAKLAFIQLTGVVNFYLLLVLVMLLSLLAIFGLFIAFKQVSIDAIKKGMK